MSAQAKKYGPMTRDELVEALRVAAGWTSNETGRFLAIRLVAEIHRLRLKTRLQRRTIAELSAGVPVAELVGAQMIPEASHEQGAREAARAEILSALAKWIVEEARPHVSRPSNSDALLTDLEAWLENQRRGLPEDPPNREAGA